MNTLFSRFFSIIFVRLKYQFFVRFCFLLLELIRQSADLCKIVDYGLKKRKIKLKIINSFLNYYVFYFVQTKEN